MNARILSFIVAGSVMLGACAPSLETTRNEAFAELDQMSGLFGTEREEITFELNIASDVSSVERAMNKARRFQDEHLQRRKEEEERKMYLAQFLDSVEGKTLTLSYSKMGVKKCAGLQVHFRSGGTVDLSNIPEECVGVKRRGQLEWEVNNDEEDRRYGLIINGVPHDEQMLGESTIKIGNDSVIPPGTYEIR